MTYWKTVDTAPEPGDEVSYLVALFPAGVVASGTVSTVSLATSDGTVLRPTHWALIELPTVHAQPDSGCEDDRASETDWVSEAKSMEQAFMCVKDEYSELARALGIRGDSWFGDPIETHEDVVRHARRVLAVLKDAELALQPFARFSARYPEADATQQILSLRDPFCPVTIGDMHAARSAVEAVGHLNAAIARPE